MVLARVLVVTGLLSALPGAAGAQALLADCMCVAKGQTTIFNKTPTKEDSYAIGAFQARIEK